MNASFRVSLLYLLLIIPQHGNSPLPVMDSWLQKDQDDGFVQREMTSSLTGGDESFDSAHQSYQNSLIRKKKSDTAGNPLPMTGYRKFTAKFDRNQRYAQPNVFFVDRYINNDYNSQVADDEKDDGVFESFDSDSRISPNKYHSRTSNLRNANDESLSPRFVSKFKGDRYADIPPSKNIMLYNGRLSGYRGDGNRNLIPLSDDMGRSAKWSLCKRLKDRYARNPTMNFPRSMPVDERRNFMGGNSLQDNYQGVDDERPGREIINQEYKDDVQINNSPEGKGPQIFDENHYYDVDVNQVPADGNLNMDEVEYNQMLNGHGYIKKRDEGQQGEGMFGNDKEPSAAAANIAVDALKSKGQSRSLTNDAISLEAVKEDLASAGMGRARSVENPGIKSEPDSDLVWKLDSNLQSKALHDVMKNSQRALQEVQFYQQKLPLKPPDASENRGYKRECKNQPSIKCERKSKECDEKRLKREDEDEQKNMKTGTDEGGGGEYEDEEGKGHKDEEEYYEDADLSDDESGNEIQTTDDLNQKYVKREVAQDAHLKKAREDQSESNVHDYELNLENAPVENSGKSRKSSFHGEGEKTKKNSARKGVKIWDQWGKWSPCSVTCGVGRSTRWRHCIGGGCAQGEKEAQIKRCTNPAC